MSPPDKHQPDNDRPDNDRPDKDSSDKDLLDEQQLDEYLRGGSDVSQQYRQLRSADVPAELDRLVLRQAQEAVKAKPAKSRTWMRWTAPLALAASAVLVVSIVIESGVHEETYVAAPASAPAEVRMEREASEQPTAAGSGAVQDKATADNDDDAKVVHVVPLDTSVDLARPTPPAAISSAEPAPSRDQTLATRSDAPPAPAPQFVSPPPDIPVDEPLQESAPATAAVVSEARLRESDLSAQQIVITAQKRRQEQQQTAGPRNTVAAPAAAAAEMNSVAEAGQSRNYSDPEQWLRDIRELRKEKKHEEADREWRRFRYVFPNYEVAEDDLARGATR